jgi:hypothetical protein
MYRRYYLFTEGEPIGSSLLKTIHPKIFGRGKLIRPAITGLPGHDTW